MKAFSNLLLGLYRQTHTTPPAQFQTQVLDAVREVLAFDSALWATGVMGQQGAVVHSICVNRQPPEMMQNWEQIKQHDAVNFEAFNHCGQTINAALTTDPKWQARFHPDALAHVKRYGMEHVLATINADPLLHVFTAVSFYRADVAQPFTEAERLLKQNLMPHLIEVWGLNRFSFLHAPRSGSAQQNHARAICDKTGVIYNASPDFAALMQLEWPDWHGPQLPDVLTGGASEAAQRHYSGHSAVVTIKSLDNMLLLSVRRKCAVDRLSRRELEVAQQFAKGLEFREIADQLNIAPTTVRNHLQAIYARLAVSNKVELARMILEAEK